MDEEGAAAEAGTLWLDKIQHELDRDGGIDRAAAGAQDVAPRGGGQRIGGSDHEALGGGCGLGDLARRGFGGRGEGLGGCRRPRCREDEHRCYEGMAAAGAGNQRHGASVRWRVLSAA